MFCNSNKRENQDHPNIIYILADDLGYGDLNCLNEKSQIPTPNMDRLKNEGIYFSDAHSNSAVCTPTRYGILTGRYCFRSNLKSGVLVGHSPSLIEKDRKTVADLLSSNGYNTACIGKWHLGLEWKKEDPEKPLFEGDEWSMVNVNVDYSAPVPGGPTDFGFDYSYIIPASLDIQPYCYINNKKVVELPTDSTPGINEKRGLFWRYGDIAPGFIFEEVLPVLTDKAVDYIKNWADNDHPSPFFLYFPLTAPHTPWVPTREFKGKSAAGDYGDFVVQVDFTVGQILNVLDSLRIADNTLIILTSDNGAHWTENDKEKYEHYANYIFKGQKADIWEGGHRVPFIARWPGHIKAGSTSKEVICHTDLIATCAGILNQTLPANAGEDSYNILPALLNENFDGSIREATIHHSMSGKFAIRKGKWKLITSLGSGGFTSPQNIEPTTEGPKGQLYNLETDIGETKNLYLENPEIVEQLTDLLDSYIKKGYSRRQ